MPEKIRVLFLSANPPPTGRIMVDVEAREISEKLKEGPYRDHFELQKETAIQAVDVQKLLLRHRPHIVHFCGHGHKTQKIILCGASGRAKMVDKQSLACVFALYNHHVRLVVFNACFTNAFARSTAKAVDYAVGSGSPIGDKAGVAFAGALYRALGFGKSVRDAFESAKAELALTKTPRSRGLQLFIRKGVTEDDRFPRIDIERKACRRSATGNGALRAAPAFECEITTHKTIRQTILFRR